MRALVLSLDLKKKYLINFIPSPTMDHTGGLASAWQSVVQLSRHMADVSGQKIALKAVRRSFLPCL